MAEFKLVISDPKTGKSYTKTVANEQARVLQSKKINDIVQGEGFELLGYEFEITGGSDHAGFPMRKDIDGLARRRILAVKGVGVRMAGKGVRRRRTVAGNTISSKTAQVNLKILKHGKQPLGGDAKQGAKEGAEGAAEKPAEKKEAKTEQDK